MKKRHQASKKVLDAFARLGLGENLPSLKTLKSLEEFVVSVYDGTNLPSNILSLADMRWYLFSPKYKNFRMHFVMMILRQFHQPP